MAMLVHFLFLGVTVLAICSSTLSEGSVIFAESLQYSVERESRQATEINVTCIQCQGLDCWRNPVTIDCEGDKDFCMSRITDHDDGTRQVVKGCATAVDCEAHFLNHTKLETRCMDVYKQVTGIDLDCYFCCKGDNCNYAPALVPPADSFFTDSDATSTS